MSSATFIDGRRTRAVMSLLARGLGSLSFGKVLLGALMLWMAAAFISIGGGSVQQAVGPVTVELVGYVDQNTDGQDNNPVIPPPKRTGGAYTAAPAATVSIPVTKPALRQPAPTTDQAAVQRPRLRVDPGQIEGLLPRPRTHAPPSSAGRANELMGGVVDLVSGVVSTVAGKKAGDQARQGLTGITDQVSTALRAGHRLNTSGESGSGNMSTAAKPGTRERATQTNTDTGASPALPAGHKSNQPACANGSDCAEQGAALTGRKPATQPARGPPSGHRQNSTAAKKSQAAIDDKHLKKITKLTNSFVQNLLELVGKAGGQGKGTGGSASQGGGSQQAGTGQSNGGSLGEQISGLVESFVSNVLKLVGAAGGGQSGQGGQGGGGSQQAGAGQGDGGSLGEQLTELTGNFVQNLLKLVGAPGGQGASRGEGEQEQPAQPIAHRPRPADATQGSGSENVNQLMGGVVDLVSGIVGTVAGKKAGAQTRQALSGLTDEISQAIAAGRNGLDSRGRGMGGSNTSTPVGSGHDGGSPSTPPDEGSGPITCQAIGVCPSQGQPTKQRAGAPQARGPPASQTQTTAKKKAPLPKGISKAQAANAEKIVKVGQKMGIPKRGLQVALATAFQESGLRNLRHGDRDSLGLFQQRPSQGWGSKAQVLNPTHAATEFFKHLKKVSGWQKKSITQAAQAVQRSALPNAYAKWAKKASALVDHVIGTGKTSKKDPNPSAAQPTNSTSTGSRTPRATDDLTGSLQALTGDFVQNLLKLVGAIGGGQTGGGSQQAGTGQGSNDLGEQISGLVQNFVSNILELVGAAGGGQGGQGGSSGQPGNGGGSTGTGGGQNNGWALNNDGQFAGTACQSDAECALANGTLATRRPESLGSPPGSATEVNRALNNRLAVLKGQKGLDKAKDQLEAKKITKAAYQKKAAAQKALQTKANRSMDQLSPDDQTLIKDTIGDQRKLATAKTKLDAERKQLAAGKLTKATYNKHAAAYNKQADALETQTEQLRDAAGYTPVEADPGRNGAGAACSRSGAFGECSTAAIDPKTGKLKQDQTLCLPGISGCTSSAKIGNRVASAGCDPAKGCTTTSRAGKTTAKTKCGAKDCDLSATADETGPHTYCQARNGTCDNNSSGRRALSGTANCRVAGGQCTAATSPGDDKGTLSYAGVNCETKGCKGTGATATKAQITAGVKGKTATRTTSAHHTCTVGATTGACSTDSSSTATRTEGVKLAKALTANSRTTGTINCDSPDCKGTQRGGTAAGASGDVKAKDSKAATRCEVHGIGGTCGSAADSEVSYRPAQTGPGGKKIPAGVVSVSHADSQVRCQDSKVCGGKARTETSARDLAVSKHWRGASTDADCTVRGGGCQGQASSDASTTTDHIRIDPRTGKPLKGQPKSGPTATSRAAANVDCQSKNCTGTAHTRSAAFDGAVNNGKPRTSQGSVKCAAGAQSCQVQTLSNATTGPGATTAYTDKPNPNRLGTGPSAASTIGGKMTGSGRLTGDVTATNPSISDRARGNKAESYCTGTGTCTAVINGAASTSPDANTITPLVQDQPTQNATTTNTQVGDNGSGNGASDQNTATGKNGKTGKATTASQQDPNQPGQGGQRPDQPATAPGSAASSGGPTIPGASSWTTAWANLNCNAGAGRCKGTPRSSATGLGPDGHNTSGTGNKGPPRQNAHTTAGCNTTGSACQATTSTTAGSGQVVADVFTGQVKDQARQARQQATEAKQAAAKAKQTAETPGATAKQRKAAAKATKTAAEATKTAKAATKAAKKPLPKSAIPATWSESTATAQCAGADTSGRCTATTTGTAAASTTKATCTTPGAQGCAVVSTATTTTGRDSGQPEGKTKKGTKPRNLPGYSTQAETSSQLSCPEVGCTGKLTANAKATAGQKNQHSRSTATGSTRCDGTRVCLAQISATTSTATTAPGVAADKRFATTTAQVSATCDNGTKTGCPTRTASKTNATGAATVKAHGTAKCAASGACQATSGGFAAKDTAQTTAGCMGTACRAKTTGLGRAPGADAKASSSCRGRGGSQDACATTAQVQAGHLPDGAAAQASASCQANKGSHCQRSYRAHAVAHDSSSRAPGIGVPGWDSSAHGEGTCSGGGSGQGAGGCGIEAHAQAGPGGYGFAKCTGDCHRFHDASYFHYTPIAPLPVPQPVVTTTGGGDDGPKEDDKPDKGLGKKEESLVVKELTPEARRAAIHSDPGHPAPPDRYGYRFDERKGTVTGKVENCTDGCRVNGSGGEQAGYDPKRKGKKYYASAPVTPGSTKRHYVDGNGGVKITRHERGHSARTYGGGYALDGRTGSTANTSGGVSHVGFSTSKKTPFRISCEGGCGPSNLTLKADHNTKKIDRLTLDKGSFSFTARDGKGNPATGSFTGQGTFTSAENDVLTLERGSASLRTRNKNGNGGYFKCQVSARGSGCTGTGAPVNGKRDVQSISAGKKGAAEFVQFLRNSDGTGGGAVAFTNGTGRANGADAYGHWIKAGGKYGGMFLLYDEGDGYNAGQGCSTANGSWCEGSDAKDRRLPWVQPTKEVTQALGMEGSGWVPSKDRRFPGGPPQMVRDGSDALLDRARAVFGYGAAKSHQRWWAEEGGRKFSPVLARIDKALRDMENGKLSQSEVIRLAKQVDPKLLKRADAIRGDLLTAAKVDQAAQRPQEAGWNDKRLLAQNPWLVDRLSRDKNGKLLKNRWTAGYQYDPRKIPNGRQLELARHNLLGLQNQLLAAEPEHEALNKRIAAYEKARNRYQNRKGGSFQWLEKEREAIERKSRDLDKREAPIQRLLLAHDLTTATTSGDRATAANIAVAGKNLDVVKRLAAAIPEPHTKAEREAAQKLAGLVDAVNGSYEATIRAPRAPTSKLHDMQLPSTLAPDLALALRAAEAYPFMRPTNGFTAGKNNPLAGMNPDQLSYWAATWNASGKQWTEQEGKGSGPALRPVNPTDIAYMTATPHNKDQGNWALIGPPYSPWYEQMKKAVFKPINIGDPDGKPIKGGEGLLDFAGATLPPDERKKFMEQAEVHGFWNLVKGFPEYLSDSWHFVNNRYVIGGYDAVFGSGTDSALRNAGRSALGFTFTWSTRWVSLAADGPAEIQNTVKHGLGTGSEPKLVNPLGHEMETWTDRYTRVHPLLGGFGVAPAVQSWQLYSGGWKHFTGEFEKDPMGASLTASLPLLLAGGGAKRGFTALGHKGAARVANIPLFVGSLPVRAAYLPMRLSMKAAATGVRGGSIMAAKGASAGARATGSRALDRAADGFGQMAEKARRLSKYGVTGSKVTRAQLRLGVRPSASEAAAEAAHRAKTRKIDKRQAERDEAGQPPDPVLTARRNALDEALRTIRADRAARAGETGANCAAVCAARAGTQHPETVDPSQVKTTPKWQSWSWVKKKLESKFGGSFKDTSADEVGSLSEAFVLAWKDGAEISHMLYKKGADWFDNRRAGPLTEREVQDALADANLQAMVPGSRAQGPSQSLAPPREVGQKPSRSRDDGPGRNSHDGYPTVGETTSGAPGPSAGSGGGSGVVDARPGGPGGSRPPAGPGSDPAAPPGPNSSRAGVGSGSGGAGGPLSDAPLAGERGAPRDPGQPRGLAQKGSSTPKDGNSPRGPPPGKPGIDTPTPSKEAKPAPAPKTESPINRAEEPSAGPKNRLRPTPPPFVGAQHGKPLDIGGREFHGLRGMTAYFGSRRTPATPLADKPSAGAGPSPAVKKRTENIEEMRQERYRREMHEQWELAEANRLRAALDAPTHEPAWVSELRQELKKTLEELRELRGKQAELRNKLTEIAYHKVVDRQRVERKIEKIDEEIGRKIIRESNARSTKEERDETRRLLNEPEQNPDGLKQKLAKLRQERDNAPDKKTRRDARREISKLENRILKQQLAELRQKRDNAPDKKTRRDARREIYKFENKMAQHLAHAERARKDQEKLDKRIARAEQLNQPPRGRAEEPAGVKKSEISGHIEVDGQRVPFKIVRQPAGKHKPRDDYRALDTDTVVVRAKSWWNKQMRRAKTLVVGAVLGSTLFNITGSALGNVIGEGRQQASHELTAAEHPHGAGSDARRGPLPEDPGQRVGPNDQLGSPTTRAGPHAPRLDVVLNSPVPLIPPFIDPSELSHGPVPLMMSGLDRGGFVARPATMGRVRFAVLSAVGHGATLTIRTHAGQSSYHAELGAHGRVGRWAGGHLTQAWQGVHEHAAALRAENESRVRTLVQRQQQHQRAARFWSAVADKAEQMLGPLRERAAVLLQKTQLPTTLWTKGKGRRPHVSWQKESDRTQAQVSELERTVAYARARAEQSTRAAEAIDDQIAAAPIQAPRTASPRQWRALFAAIALISRLREQGVAEPVLERLGDLVSAIQRDARPGVGAAPELRRLQRALDLPSARATALIGKITGRHRLDWDEPTRRAVANALATAGAHGNRGGVDGAPAKRGPTDQATPHSGAHTQAKGTPNTGTEQNRNRGPPALRKIAAVVAALFMAALLVFGTNVGQAHASIEPGRTATLTAHTGSDHAGARRQVFVQPGDTLGRLARATNTRVADWIEANPGRLPANAGRNHVITATWLNAPDAWDGTWRVQRNDMLNRIAARFHVNPFKLAHAQGHRFPTIESRDHIDTGEKFAVPGMDRPHRPAPHKPAPHKPAPPAPAKHKTAFPWLLLLKINAGILGAGMIFGLISRFRTGIVDRINAIATGLPWPGARGAAHLAVGLVNRIAGPLPTSTADQPGVRWVLLVAVAVAAMVDAVVTGYVGWKPTEWLGPTVIVVRALLLTFRDDSAVGAHLTGQSAGGNSRATNALAMLALGLFFTRIVSVETNAQASGPADLLIDTGNWVSWAGAWAAVGTWIAHSTTGVRFEVPHLSRGVFGRDWLRMTLARWWVLGLFGFGLTWLGNAAAVLQLGITIPPSSPNSVPAAPFGPIISMATLTVIGIGVIGLNVHFFLNEALGSNTQHRYERIELAMHNQSLAGYGLNALYGLGAAEAHHFPMWPFQVSAAGLAGVMIGWSILRRGPPSGRLRAWLTTAYVAGINLLSIGAGVLAYDHTHADYTRHPYAWPMIATVATAFALVGVSWLVDRVAWRRVVDRRVFLYRLTRDGVHRTVVDDLRGLLRDGEVSLADLRELREQVAAHGLVAVTNFANAHGLPWTTNARKKLRNVLAGPLDDALAEYLGSLLVRLYVDVMTGIGTLIQAIRNMGPGGGPLAVRPTTGGGVEIVHTLADVAEDIAALPQHPTGRWWRGPTGRAQLVAAPGLLDLRPDVAILFWVTRNRAGEPIVLADPRVLAAFRTLPTDLQNLIIRRELLRIAHDDAAVRAFDRNNPAIHRAAGQLLDAARHQAPSRPWTKILTGAALTTVVWLVLATPAHAAADAGGAQAMLSLDPHQWWLWAAAVLSPLPLTWLAIRVLEWEAERGLLFRLHRWVDRGLGARREARELHRAYQPGPADARRVWPGVRAHLLRYERRAWPHARALLTRFLSEWGRQGDRERVARIGWVPEVHRGEPVWRTGPAENPLRVGTASQELFVRLNAQGEFEGPDNLTEALELLRALWPSSRPILNTAGLGVREATDPAGQAWLLVFDQDILVELVRAPTSIGPGPVTPRQAWRHLAAALPRSPNLRLDETPFHLADAERAGITPVRAGTPQARALLASPRNLIWVVRTDGTVWLNRLNGRAPGRQAVEIRHTVPAAGGAILTGGERPRLRGLNVDTGYHQGNTATRNRAALLLGRAAFTIETGDVDGGLVAVGPNKHRAREAMLAHAENLFNAGRWLEPDQFPAQPRGPPVNVRLVPAHRRPTGAEGAIAFGFTHDTLAPDGAVLIFTDTFAEILDHIAAGRLPTNWFARLLEHERDDHILGDLHTGPDHDAHANPLADEFLQAQESLTAARGGAVRPITNAARVGVVAVATAGAFIAGIIASATPALAGAAQAQAEPVDGATALALVVSGVAVTVAMAVRLGLVSLPRVTADAVKARVAALRSRQGAAAAGVGLGFATALVATLWMWTLPPQAGMVAFLVRGAVVTAAMVFLSQSARVRRVVTTVIVVTFTINLPLHIQGTFTGKLPDSYQWTYGLFGLVDVTSLAVQLVALALLWGNPPGQRARDLVQRVTDAKPTDLLNLVGYAATAASLPFLSWAAVVQRDHDEIASINTLVLTLVLATFAGFGGDSLYTLGHRLVRAVTGKRAPAKLTTFMAGFSAVTIAAYGGVYLLHAVPVLAITSSTLVSAGLLYWAFSLDRLTPRDESRLATTAGAIWVGITTVAAASELFGWPHLSTWAAFPLTELDLTAATVWLWFARRGPPPPPTGPTSAAGPTAPAGPTAAQATGHTPSRFLGLTGKTVLVAVLVVVGVGVLSVLSPAMASTGPGSPAEAPASAGVGVGGLLMAGLATARRWFSRRGPAAGFVARHRKASVAAGVIGGLGLLAAGVLVKKHRSASARRDAPSTPPSASPAPAAAAPATSAAPETGRAISRAIGRAGAWTARKIGAVGKALWHPIAAHPWGIGVTVSVLTMVAVVVVGASGLLVWPLFYALVGPIATHARGLLLWFRDDTGWGDHLTQRAGELENPDQPKKGVKAHDPKNKWSAYAVASIALGLALTRTVSVLTNSWAWTHVMVEGGTVATAAAGLAAGATWIAHKTTAERYEVPAILRGFLHVDGLDKSLMRWWFVGTFGYAFTWIGNGAALVQMALATPPRSPDSLPAGTLGAIVSMSTLTVIGLGVLYLNWHFYREEVLGKEPNHRHIRIALAMHNLPLTAYGLNALYGYGASEGGSMIWFKGALGVTVLAMIAWSIPRRGPPVGILRGWLRSGYVALVTLGGALAGVWVFQHTHPPADTTARLICTPTEIPTIEPPNYAWTVLAVVAADAAIVGVSWLIDRLVLRLRAAIRSITRPGPSPGGGPAKRGR